MYTHILVPVDGSDTANLALEEAIRLARNEGANLRIIHVADSATYIWDAEFTPVDLKQIQESIRRFAQSVLDRALGAARDAGVSADTRLIEIDRLGQRVATKITEEAREWPADLIVIGTHGRRGLDHLLMGSVAEGVVRTAPVPVLLVRAS